jgi:lysophospholipase L1-like esterase
MNGRSLSPVKKCLFSLVTCLALFGGVELVWRAVHGWNWTWLDCHRAHPRLGWSLREGWQGSWEWTAGASHINRQGLRDDRDVGPKPPGEKRLLILGDSITFGARVHTEQAYPRQLESALAHAGRHWRVLNGGVTGYDPAQEADWLEVFGLALQPDAIAIGFCCNDILPSDRAEWTTKYGANQASQWWNEHSIAYYGLQRGLQRLAARVQRYFHPRPTDSCFEDMVEHNWPFVEMAYRQIACRARERHVPVYVIVFPAKEDVQGFFQHSMRRRLQAFCDEAQWQMIDLFEVFRAEPERLYLPDDGIHPSVLGHRRAAEHIAEEMLISLPKTSDRRFDGESCSCPDDTQDTAAPRQRR